MSLIFFFNATSVLYLSNEIFFIFVFLKVIIFCSFIYNAQLMKNIHINCRCRINEPKTVCLITLKYYASRCKLWFNRNANIRNYIYRVGKQNLQYFTKNNLKFTVNFASPPCIYSSSLLKTTNLILLTTQNAASSNPQNWKSE